MIVSSALVKCFEVPYNLIKVAVLWVGLTLQLGFCANRVSGKLVWRECYIHRYQLKHRQKSGPTEMVLGQTITFSWFVLQSTLKLTSLSMFFFVAMWCRLRTKNICSRKRDRETTQAKLSATGYQEINLRSRRVCSSAQS